LSDSSHRRVSRENSTPVWSPHATHEELESYRSFVGVDLHKSNVTLRAVARDGAQSAGLTTSTKSVRKIDAWLEALPKPVWMAVEAVGFVEWFIDRFRDRVARIDLADAAQLANRRGKRRKNDPNDALDIARRLARRECPLAFIAEPEIMHLRKLGRQWRRLSRTLSRIKQCTKSILLAANLQGPRFDAASAQRWLLAHGDLLKDADRDSFENLLEIVSLVERQKSRLHSKIVRTTRSPRFAQDIERLKTVPGIGVVWSCIICAEIGPFERFPNAEALEFWAGITPDNETSDGKTRAGAITKAGSATLRWALGEAAMILCQHDPAQERHRQRLIDRAGNAKANVAMGRRLLRILYAMMRDGKDYKRNERSHHLDAANKARLGPTRRKLVEEFAEA
jgi:transposase